ncbi:MAG: Ig domain-containing protein, partial [Microvirga sp.]
SRAFTVVVAKPPAIATRSLSGARLRRPYSAALARTGGTPGYRWAVTSGRLPSGLKLKASGALRGTPKARGRSTFTVTLTDARGVRSRHTFALRVR